MPKVLTCATGRTSNCGPGRDIWGFTDHHEHRRVPMMHTDGHDSHVLVRAARKPTTTKNFHFEYDFRSADLKWTVGLGLTSSINVEILLQFDPGNN